MQLPIRRKYWHALAVSGLLMVGPIIQIAGSAQLSTDSADPDLVIIDAAGNPLAPRGIALVDWDGYIANPAVKLTLAPGANIKKFPAKVNLSASDPLMYFDSPSSIGAKGPAKSVTFRNASAKVVVYLSIFPDRAGKDKDEVLQYQISEADGAKHLGQVPIHVFDQDENHPSAFKITVDFSYDQTGFFKDPVRRQIAQQAADDWAYFIDDMGVDGVPAGGEKIWVYPPATDFTKPELKTNPSSYAGFFFELYGVDDPVHRSGGNGSDQSFQSRHGTNLPLRRSGNVAVETKGNYNTTGWLSLTKDSDWWMTNNRDQSQTDLYSIVHHEMGHALGFTQNYPLEKEARQRGDFESPALLAYHGKYPKVNDVDHLDGEIDDASRRGAFGNEYNDKLPEGRWLITKLDVLCLESIGYKIRRPFDLSIQTNKFTEGRLQSPYTTVLRAKGGLPWYQWAIESGALPDGLNLDADTGKISGLPSRAGNFTFKLRLTDSSEAKASVVSESLTIAIR